jgi:hypothetical protein
MGFPALSGTIPHQFRYWGIIGMTKSALNNSLSPMVLLVEFRPGLIIFGAG